MRIAVILWEFPALNETFVLDQITGFLDRGHDVHIYATAPKGEPKLHGAIEKYDLLARTTYRDARRFSIPENRFRRAVHALSLLRTDVVRNPLSTLKTLNIFVLGAKAASLAALYEASPFLDCEASYDVLHCHGPDNGELAVCMRELGAIHGKVVTQFHSYHLPYFRNGRADSRYPNLFRKGDLFLTSGEHSKRFFDRVGWGGKHMIIHRYSVDVSLYRRSKGAVRDDGEIRLLSVGRLVEKKGLTDAIDAVARIVDRFPRVRYYIAGDGPLRQRLEQQIARLGLENHVKLLGFQTREEVLAQLRQVDIYLGPCVTSDGSLGGWAGDVETGPVVLMEAMAAEIPVLTTWHTGIPEFVEDGESGFLVQEKDVEGLAGRLSHLLAHPETWRSMGARGRKRIEEFHNKETQNDRLLEIYRLLQKPQTANELYSRDSLPPLDDKGVAHLAATLGGWNESRAEIVPQLQSGRVRVTNRIDP
jgi:colanic acid/amylovoran biosynthesis glycosyltransferase